jgi:hypothetical protein
MKSAKNTYDAPHSFILHKYDKKLLISDNTTDCTHYYLLEHFTPFFFSKNHMKLNCLEVYKWIHLNLKYKENVSVLLTVPDENITLKQINSSVNYYVF